MRSVAAVSLAVAALMACASGSAVRSAPTSLTITFWAEGPDASQARRSTLRCNPSGGTHPRPAAACRRLAAGGIRLFAPVPRGAVCTEIYGGPQTARVVGTVAGRRVWAKFSRTNGCHIGRWDRLSPWLVPRGGVT